MVNKGIPQGSPLSPLLFIIYVRSLHPDGEQTDTFTSSYVDDFQITVSSTSWYRNTRILEERVRSINSAAASLGLSFSIAKTEMMHWRTRREKGDRSECPIMFQSHVVQPAGKAIKWLGFWLTDNGETSTHFTKRLALAQAAFLRIQRLSMPGKGLTPYGARRLAKGIILPILLYGAEIFDPTVTMIDKMQKFWNRVLRWITNAFYATNITVVSAEACLAPIKLYMRQTREMTAVRITTAIPSNNIATAMLPGGYPMVDDYRYPTNRRQAFDNNKGGMRPKVWNSTSTTSAQVRLPIDEVGAIAASFYTARPFPMKPNRLSMVTEQAAKSWVEAKDAVRKKIQKTWVDWEYPPYYEYRPPYRECWYFMTLPKFKAGRIHQMRANKSYLKAQKDWSNQDQDPRCDRCGQHDQTFQHIITTCPALEPKRRGRDPEIFNIGRDSMLWKGDKPGKALMKEFSVHVMKNLINFPIRLGVFPFTRDNDLRS